jgi:SAM-dependent methyltransferase
VTELLPEEQVTVKNYDKFASAWASERNTKNFWAQELQRFHELLPKGTILEIGSGHGRDAEDLLELGYDYVGTDISVGLINIIRQRFPDQKFYQQSVYELDFQEGQNFDGFWAAAVLLHVPKSRMDEALQSIRRVVNTDAIGFISLKDGQGEGVQDDVVGRETMRRFFSYWTKEDFTEVIDANGYEVVDYIYHPVSEKTKWHSFLVRTLGDQRLQNSQRC